MLPGTGLGGYPVGGLSSSPISLLPSTPSQGGVSVFRGRYVLSGPVPSMIVRGKDGERCS